MKPRLRFRTLAACAALLALALSVPSRSADRSYQVRLGDTLWSIASRELGDGHRWSDLAAANNIAAPYLIEAGQSLTIPAAPGAAARLGSGPSPPSSTPSLTPLPVVADDLPAATLSEPAPEPVGVRAAPAPLPPLEPAIRVARPGVSASAFVEDALTIEAAVGVGLAHAPEIAGAQASLRRTNADVGVARSGALPQFNATGDVRRSETFKSTSLLGVDEITSGGTLSVSQAVWSFGRLSSAIRAASAQEAATLASLAAAKSRVRFRVESAFLNLLLARVRVKVASEAVDAAAALERRARLREEVGVGTRFDIARSLADRASREARLAAAAAAVDAAREELAVAMGLPPGIALETVGDLFESPRPIHPADAVRIGLEERPDLVALEYSIRSGHALIDYEKAQAYPSLAATGAWTYTYHDYITSSPFFVGREASTGYIGLGVSVPLFDGFRVQERVRSQAAAVDELKSRRDRGRLDAERDIRAVYFDLDAAQRALAARRAGVAAAREAARMAEVSYDAGRATTLDVIEASASLAEASGAEAEAAFSYRLGISRLVAASGTDGVVLKP
jgi:outer membrane protein TolC